MKATIVILGILGAFAAGGLGMKWLGDFGQLGELERFALQSQLAAQGDSLDGMITASFILLGAFFAGLAGAYMAVRNKFPLAGGLLLGAGILPVLFSGKTAIFTSLLIVAGVIAFVAHSKQTTVTA